MNSADVAYFRVKRTVKSVEKFPSNLIVGLKHPLYIPVDELSC